jgi:hypothetical protein
MESKKESKEGTIGVAPLPQESNSSDSSNNSNNSNNSINSNSDSDGNGGRMDNCEIRVFDVCESGFWARPELNLVPSLPLALPTSDAITSKEEFLAAVMTTTSGSFTFPNPTSIIASFPETGTESGGEDSAPIPTPQN